MHRQQLPRRPKSQGYSSNTKGAIIGNTTGTVPPAWRMNLNATQQRPGHHDELSRNGSGSHGPYPRRGPGSKTGSKIFMSQLPADESIKERDIEELFRETIGPVFDVFLLYNSQGKSKGMAVAHFQRIEDAAAARQMYDGKIIDGRRPLKIELITDPPEGAPSLLSKGKSLVERLGYSRSNGNTKLHAGGATKGSVPMASAQPQPGIKRRNIKKGPRRLKKSAEQLDREMEAYRAEAPRFTKTSVSAALGVELDGNAMQE